MTDRARLDGLLADLSSIYPGSAVTTGRLRTDASARSFRLLPSRRRPRVLLPVGCAGAARRAVLVGSANDGARDTMLRRATAAVAAGPLGRAVFPGTVSVRPVGTDSLETHLAAQVGASIRLSIHGGAARANAKPVVGVHRVDGAEVGFCKVGVTTLASLLVAQEVAALRRLAGAQLRSLTVPVLVHAGSWHGCEIALLSALRGDRGRGKMLPVAAMREVAGVAGTRVRSLRDSPWAAAVHERSAAAAPEVTARVRRTLERLVERDGDESLVHGAAHGDWGPWNMSWSGDRALVWDWERFALDQPIGIDAVHFTAHARLRRVGDLRAAVAALHDAETAVCSVLRDWPGPAPSAAPGSAARTVVDAYLLDVACRFAVDANQVGSPPAARLAAWYLDVAAARWDAAAVSVASGRYQDRS